MQAFPYRDMIFCHAHSGVCVCVGGGGGLAQSVERATPGEEALCSISAVAAPSLLVGSVSVEHYIGTKFHY